MTDTNRVTSIQLHQQDNGKIKATLTETGVVFGSEQYDHEFDTIELLVEYLVKSWNYADKQDKLDEEGNHEKEA